jgi:hypothetical protein
MWCCKWFNREVFEMTSLYPYHRCCFHVDHYRDLLPKSTTREMREERKRLLDYWESELLKAKNSL